VSKGHLQHTEDRDDTTGQPTNIDTTRLRAIGLLTSDDLRESTDADATAPDVIEGWIKAASVNIVVGDSGLGKTPLVLQLGLAAAAGVPVLGRRTQQGRVLYFDGESGRADFLQQLERITGHLGLPGGVPSDFLMWSPNWANGATAIALGKQIEMFVGRARPALCIIDPLRVYWPLAEKGTDDAVAMVATLRNLAREHGTAFAVVHHVRKTNQKGPRPDLEACPSMWLQEAAGSRALVNQTDLRLGVDVCGRADAADLVVAGLLRGAGTVGPLYLRRHHDAGGVPAGYDLAQDVELLNTRDREAFRRLPARFKFAVAKRELGGNSDSNTARLLQRCQSLGLVEKPEGTGWYRKVQK
jgi:hypothetical protein